MGDRGTQPQQAMQGVHLAARATRATHHLHRALPQPKQRRASHSPTFSPTIAPQTLPGEPGSALRHCGGAGIAGVTKPMLYCGQLFSTFAWHVEDHFMCVVSCFGVGSWATSVDYQNTPAGQAQVVCLGETSAPHGTAWAAWAVTACLALPPPNRLQVFHQLPAPGGRQDLVSICLALCATRGCWGRSRLLCTPPPTCLARRAALPAACSEAWSDIAPGEAGHAAAPAAGPPRRYGVPASDADGFEGVAWRQPYRWAVEQMEREGASEAEVRRAWEVLAGSRGCQLQVLAVLPLPPCTVCAALLGAHPTLSPMAHRRRCGCEWSER